MKSYLIKIGSLMSQLANVMFFNGHPNESISGRSARITLVEKKKHWFWNRMYVFVNRLFFLQENHCLDAHLNERVWCRAVLTHKL